MEPKNNLLGSLLDLKPVETKRASEVIYDQIKEMITSGRLKPGDRLPSERAMMEMLSRSRPTIREALRMLERTGLIRTVAGSNGAIVQKPNTRSVEQALETAIQTQALSLSEVWEYRHLNETAIVEWASQRRTAKDLEALDKILEQSRESVDDPGEFIKYDPLFHAALAKASKNTVAYLLSQILAISMVALLEQRMAELDMKTQQAMCRKVLVMHADIVAALKSRDKDAARRAMEAHIEAFHEDLRPGTAFAYE
ncbi:transcriptional regulator, GntR family [Alkalispirochaeta americana]|uniref:Transcriptional regulator, GntR family n=1 Tax=Alkalispirochaeta americana TaxID=159291 RepID=A0A1N6SY12_9SPIO|nr:FadR/GntR family transcriptional regulator [Alkalispirochaeta americana]SIQ45952.1 transcriptional regulator, GntR family [Alkalispirochaeta americana]